MRFTGVSCYGDSFVGIASGARFRSLLLRRTDMPRSRILADLQRCAAFLMLSCGLTIGATAQARPAPTHAAGQRFHSPKTNAALSSNSPLRGLRHSSPYSSLLFPLLADSFDPESQSSSDPTGSPTTPFLMEAVRALGGGAKPAGHVIPALNGREPTSAEPLMIELQNGAYVRVRNSPADREALPLPPSSSNTTSSASTTKSGLRTKTNVRPEPGSTIGVTLPPVVLVFSDGHSEQVQDYTIADGALYVRGDFYKDGYWSKQIRLTSLNLPQTVQANADRNIKFVLPSSSNEVIARF